MTSHPNRAKPRPPAKPALARTDPHEQWVLAHATHFTTCIFRGAGVFETAEWPTLDAARTAARGLALTTPRGVAIYAVYGIHQGHIENVAPIRRTN